MSAVETIVRQIPDRILLAAFVLVLGVVLGYLANLINHRLLDRAGVPEAVEGTAFERTARSVGTSTVAIVSQLSMWFIIGVAILAALSVAEIGYIQVFIGQVTTLFPQLFLAAIVIIVGIVVGDKLELVVSERLRGVKLPEIGVLPGLVKYSVVYIALLIALGQVGVVIEALLILLAAYALAVIVLGGLAFKDLLSSGAAGIYLLLNQPYGIGDEVIIGQENGIVQEVDVFVTRIERDGREYVVPNNMIFQHGIVRTRRD